VVTYLQHEGHGGREVVVDGWNVLLATFAHPVKATINQRVKQLPQVLLTTFTAVSNSLRHVQANTHSSFVALATFCTIE